MTKGFYSICVCFIFRFTSLRSMLSREFQRFNKYSLVLELTESKAHFTCMKKNV